MIITPEIKLIRDFGIKYNWPSMVLKRDGDVIVKRIGSGKNVWKNVASMAFMKEPYNNTFLELLNAVKIVDVWQKE